MTSNTYTSGDPIGYPYTISDYALGMAPKGWECPRCRKIHAPFISGCTCASGYSLAVGPVWSVPSQTVIATYPPTVIDGTLNTETGEITWKPVAPLDDVAEG